MGSRTPRHRIVTRGIVASIAACALTLVGAVTPAQASPMELARRTAAATLAEVRAAAEVQDVRVKAETEAPAPQAEGTIDPGKKTTITADDLGASATFSGNKAPSELSVTLGVAPKVALRSARSESPNGGVVVSDPVEIVAKDRAGKSVTSFPPKAVNTRGGGKDGPVVSDVVPGVSLSLKPDSALVAASKVDVSTLQIYTRESDGEQWTLLPSYYDGKAGVVRGESDHLSQFVVIGTPFRVPPGPSIVLDPDNDEGHVTTPAPPVTEWGFNQSLASGLKTMFENNCKATVTITNTGPNTMLSRDIRAGIAAAANPVATLGIGFNTLRASPGVVETRPRAVRRCIPGVVLPMMRCRRIWWGTCRFTRVVPRRTWVTTGISPVMSSPACRTRSHISRRCSWTTITTVR